MEKPPLSPQISNSYPTIIQGGMGAGVSGWRLAKAVAKTGQLGVVSGTALDNILSRRLQNGDLGGHIRRALAQFPIKGITERILETYFVEGGISADKPFKPFPVPSIKPSRKLVELTVASNFVEVFLSKENCSGPVGINYLEKIQLPHIPSIYGAMLAGVDYILMGAGIPRAIPGIMDNLALGLPVKMKIDVKGAACNEEYFTHFDPVEFCDGQPVPGIARPKFLAIISSATLATMMARKASGKVDGFVVEGATAGGHNAPPRGALQLTKEGEPIYTERDDADLVAIKALGLPFWLAGSYAEPHRLAEAMQMGAAGIQVGTAFAYCNESELTAEIKSKVLKLSQAGKAKIYTDPRSSPTGFPFKVLQMEDTLSEAEVYEKRTRICDLGYLRHAYKIDGSDKIGWRCPSEPIKDFLRKGGDISETVGRKCVCNGLVVNIGMPTRRPDSWQSEREIITSGDDVANVARFLRPGATTYSAREVVDYLLQDISKESHDSDNSNTTLNRHMPTKHNSNKESDIPAIKVKSHGVHVTAK